MQRTTGGVKYDTDEARLIGRYNNMGYGADSPHAAEYWEAGLYQDPKSTRYFIAGKGGALSHYAKAVGPGWSSGECIDPLDRDEAYEWAEEYLSEDIVEQEFGDMLAEA